MQSIIITNFCCTEISSTLNHLKILGNVGKEHYFEIVPELVDAVFCTLVKFCPSLLLRNYVFLGRSFLYPIALLTFCQLT